MFYLTEPLQHFHLQCSSSGFVRKVYKTTSVFLAESAHFCFQTHNPNPALWKPAKIHLMTFELHVNKPVFCSSALDRQCESVDAAHTHTLTNTYTHSQTHTCTHKHSHTQAQAFWPDVQICGNALVYSFSP